MSRLDPSALPPAGQATKWTSDNDDYRRRNTITKYDVVTSQAPTVYPDLSRTSPRRPPYAYSCADIEGANPRDTRFSALGHASNRSVNPLAPGYYDGYVSSAPVAGNDHHAYPLSKSDHDGPTRMYPRDPNDTSDIPGTKATAPYTRRTVRDTLNVQDIQGTAPSGRTWSRAVDNRPDVDVGQLKMWHQGDTGHFLKSNRNPTNPLNPAYDHDPKAPWKTLEKSRGDERQQRPHPVAARRGWPDRSEGEMPGRLQTLGKGINHVHSSCSPKRRFDHNGLKYTLSVASKGQ